MSAQPKIAPGSQSNPGARASQMMGTGQRAGGLNHIEVQHRRIVLDHVDACVIGGLATIVGSVIIGLLISWAIVGLR